ncbi:hypothetical protein [Brevibacillus sp. SYSU BS000544]|uniref:hypothetical protein n=1 Tax=Brevibacillus sp. SYSU BS000544 TaxID=3416443 RepID=UPI003CE4BEB4
MKNRKIVVLHDEQDKTFSMLPKTFLPILATTSDTFFEKVDEYKPDLCLILPSLIEKQPWEWLPLVKSEYIVIRAASTQEHVLFQLLQQSYPQLVVLEPLLTEEEIQKFLTFLLEGSDTKARDEEVDCKIRVFLGSGGTGITSLFLLAAPWYAEQNPDKKILLVDMNEDKRDLSVTLRAQAAQLSHMRSYLVRGNDEFMPFTVQHPSAKNVSVISAVEAWGNQEVATFFRMVRKQYDEVWIDIGRPFHAARIQEEADQIIYVVRPDSLSLGGMLRIIQPAFADKSRLLLTHFDDRYTSIQEVKQFLGQNQVMGVIPYEYPLLPLKIDKGQIPLSKKMRKALEKLDWTFTQSRRQPGAILQRLFRR